MLRLFDVLFASLGLLFGFPLLALIALIGLFDTGDPLFRQERVGRGKQGFVLFKFRTMKVDTESMATHLVSASAVTVFGRFLRSTKLDELPQLWNVVRGDMSLVGPRPCLFNQVELIDARQRLGVFSVRPGITGLAQIKGVDMATPELLAKIDAEMIATMDVGRYFAYIGFTLAGKGAGDRVQKG